MSSERCTTHHDACACREAARERALLDARASARYYEAALDEAIDAMDEEGSPGSSLAQAIRELRAVVEAADALAQAVHEEHACGNQPSAALMGALEKYVTMRGRDDVERIRARALSPAPECFVRTDVTTLLAALDAERARAERAERERDEAEALRARLAGICEATINALRGPPPDLTLWSWHDIAEHAARVVRERDEARQLAVRVGFLARRKALEEALDLVAEHVGPSTSPWADAWNAACEALARDLRALLPSPEACDGR